MKKLIYLIIICLLVGIWLGINLARDQPPFSNPFVDEDIREKAVDKVERMGQEAKGAVERTIEKAVRP